MSGGVNMATMVGQRRRYDAAGSEPCDWAALINEHRAIARHALRSVLGPCPEEEDLLQEVALRLVARAKEPGEISLSAWSWRVAHNVAVDHRRKRSALPAEEVSLDRPVGEGLDDAVIAAEFADAVEAAVQRLPERQRHAVVANAVFDGERGGHTEIAEALGVSPKAVESILGRARKSLRKDLHIPIGAGVVVAAFTLIRRLLRGKEAALAMLAGAVTAGVGLTVFPAWRDTPSQPAPVGPAHLSNQGRSAQVARPPGTPANVTGTTASPTVTPTTVAAVAGWTGVAAPTTLQVDVTVPLPNVPPIVLPSVPALTIPPTVSSIASSVGQDASSVGQDASQLVKAPVAAVPPLVRGVTLP